MDSNPPYSPTSPPQNRNRFLASLETLLVSLLAGAYFVWISYASNTLFLLPVVLPGVLVIWLIRIWLCSLTGARPSFRNTVIVVAILYFPMSLIAGMEHGTPAAARRSQCRNNLKQIGLALHNYHDAYGCFPPVCVEDAEGRPMHSWRVLILPYMDEEDLYDRYDFGEPWNGPNNRILSQKIPRIYQCPASEVADTPSTSYLAVVGPDTIWPPDGTVGVSDVEDGTNNTLLVVESPASDIHWLEPRDMDVGDLRYGVNHDSGRGIGTRNRCCRRHQVLGANSVLVDGSACYLGTNTTHNDLRALATIAGGEDVDAIP